MQTQDVAVCHEGVKVDVTCLQLIFDFRRDAISCVINHLNIKAF